MNRAINTITQLSEAPEYTQEDIIDLMDKLGANEKAFALLMNVPASTVRQWMSGTVVPGTASNRLMQIYDLFPQIVGKIIAARL